MDTSLLDRKKLRSPHLVVCSACICLHFLGITKNQNTQNLHCALDLIAFKKTSQCAKEFLILKSFYSRKYFSPLSDSYLVVGTNIVLNSTKQINLASLY